MTQAQLLAHTMDRSRDYTLSYFNRIKDQDLHREFECDGKKLNSAYWLIAHLAATENGLLLIATGGPFNKFSWAKHFMPGAVPPKKETCPPFDEVFGLFHSIHEKAMTHVATLSDEALEGPNQTGIAMIGHTTHDVITHAIRHESVHTGHLGWLCKLYGVRTV